MVTGTGPPGGTTAAGLVASRLVELGEGEGPLALREGEAEEGRDQPGPVVVEG